MCGRTVLESAPVGIGHSQERRVAAPHHLLPDLIHVNLDATSMSSKAFATYSSAARRIVSRPAAHYNDAYHGRT